MFREAHFGGNSWERHGSDSCTSQGGGSLRAGVWGGCQGRGTLEAPGLWRRFCFLIWTWLCGNPLYNKALISLWCMSCALFCILHVILDVKVKKKKKSAVDAERWTDRTRECAWTTQDPKEPAGRFRKSQWGWKELACLQSSLSDDRKAIKGHSNKL